VTGSAHRAPISASPSFAGKCIKSKLAARTLAVQGDSPPENDVAPPKGSHYVVVQPEALLNL
jgi:hypothetical protein